MDNADLATIDTFEISALKGIGAPSKPEFRKPQMPLLEGLKTVSADDRWEVSQDIFYERFPEHIKNLAPRCGSTTVSGRSISARRNRKRWVPPMLQSAEAIYGTYLDSINSPSKRQPIYYWHNHCYATFQNDRLCLPLNYISEDRVMWAGDYPTPKVRTATAPHR